MAGKTFVSPVGYIDLDNDCNYSIDLKSTRNREYIDPKQDLPFYFETYLVPRFGLDNINVNNVASFMKELQMNWTKIDPDLKSKVMDILIVIIFSDNNNEQFKQEFLKKLNESQPSSSSVPSYVPSSSSVPSMSSFG